jgi:predicted DNA repair protein MutK
MASGFFALLDDISMLMDDVATLSKVAGKKTAGILGDDLAVNAEKASGFMASREIPVLWAITKGSFLNKLIILPLAFLLSAFVPEAIHIILLFGGLYLAYEGAEKIYAFFFHRTPKKKIEKVEKLTKEEALSQEKEKVKSAIITDFILSVEIIIIALGTVENENLLNKIIVVSIIALVATVGVYGIVALIVRMDEFGVKLINLNEQENSFSDKVGKFLVQALPKVIKGLTVIGTIALLLVSGGIFAHNLDFLHGLFPTIPSFITEFFIGLVVGIIVLAVVELAGFVVKKIKSNKS